MYIVHIYKNLLLLLFRERSTHVPCPGPITYVGHTHFDRCIFGIIPRYRESTRGDEVNEPGSFANI